MDRGVGGDRSRRVCLMVALRLPHATNLTVRLSKGQGSGGNAANRKCRGGRTRSKRRGTVVPSRPADVSKEATATWGMPSWGPPHWGGPASWTKAGQRWRARHTFWGLGWPPPAAVAYTPAGPRRLLHHDEKLFFFALQAQAAARGRRSTPAIVSVPALPNWSTLLYPLSLWPNREADGGCGRQVRRHGVGCGGADAAAPPSFTLGPQEL